MEDNRLRSHLLISRLGTINADVLRGSNGEDSFQPFPKCVAHWLTFFILYWPNDQTGRLVNVTPQRTINHDFLPKNNMTGSLKKSDDCRFSRKG